MVSVIVLSVIMVIVIAQNIFTSIVDHFYIWQKIIYKRYAMDYRDSK